MRTFLINKTPKWLVLAVVRIALVLVAILFRWQGRKIQKQKHRLLRSIDGTPEDSSMRLVVQKIIDVGDTAAIGHKSVATHIWRSSFRSFEDLDPQEFDKVAAPLLAASEQLKAMSGVLNKGRSSVAIAKPPAMRLVKILRVVVCPKAKARVVEPIIADMHHEYYEALKLNDKWAARAAIGRCYFALFRASWSAVFRIFD